MTVFIVFLMDVIERADSLVDLGQRLDAEGLAGNELAVRRLARDARAAGLGGVAAEVLADPTAPDVARLRAFAVVSASIVSADRSAGATSAGLAPRSPLTARPDGRHRPVA